MTFFDHFNLVLSIKDDPVKCVKVCDKRVPHVPIHSSGPGLAQGHLIPFVVELSNWMR